MHNKILSSELSLVMPDATLVRMEEERGLPIYVTFDHISLLLKQDSCSSSLRHGSEPWRPRTDNFLVDWAHYDSPQQNFTIYASEVSKQWVKHYIASLLKIMENGAGTISLEDSDRPTIYRYLKMTLQIREEGYQRVMSDLFSKWEASSSHQHLLAECIFRICFTPIIDHNLYGENEDNIVSTS